MKELLIIKENDAYDEYGAQLLDGALGSLVAFPKLKPYPKNDWQERSGIEADLSAPKLDKREIKIRMAVSAYKKLIGDLSNEVYNTFEFKQLERIYKLRFIQADVQKYNSSFSLVSLTLSDDFPMKGYEYSPPHSNIALNDCYTIDGIPTTAYGLNILQGTLANILKAPKIKPLMERNIRSLCGVIYDDRGNVTVKEKDVQLKCLMRADSIREFWTNRNALLHNLTKPGERTLYVKSLGQRFKFCYKSCTVSRFYATPPIWAEFTLTITFTYSSEKNKKE